jgi:hypothetical protein
MKLTVWTVGPTTNTNDLQVTIRNRLGVVGESVQRGHVKS